MAVLGLLIVVVAAMDRAVRLPAAEKKSGAPPAVNPGDDIRCLCFFLLW